MSDQYLEFPVSRSRGGNWKLPSQNDASNGNQHENHDETTDLKTIAIRRLQKIRGNHEGNCEETSEFLTVKLLPSQQEVEVSNPGQGAGTLDWLQWVAEQVPLVKEDREYVWARLATLPPQAMERAAKRYIQTWADAAGAEPKIHCKENAGRRAANKTLLSLVRPGSWRHRHDHRKP